MFIFNKIFRLASFNNQDNQEIYKFKRSNYFTSFILKVHVLFQNIQKIWHQLFNTQSPSLIFKIIGYNFNTFQDIPVPKSQEKELSCRQSFSSKLVQNTTILYIFYQNFSGGGLYDWILYMYLCIEVGQFYCPISNKDWRSSEIK